MTGASERVGHMQAQRHPRRGFLAALQLVAAAAMCAGLSGCVVIGGTSRGGFFLFPGGLGLLLMILLLVVLLRRR